MSESHTEFNLPDEAREKEKQPRKVIILIRHPRQEFRFRQPYKLAQPEEDAGAHLPISRKGLEQVRQLSEYLVEALPSKTKSLEYAIYSSPIRRAERTADILRTNINLNSLEKREVPVPKNIKNTILDCFDEITFEEKKELKKDYLITKEANRRKEHIMDVWLEHEGENLLPRFQQKLNDLRKGFDYLKQQPTKLDLVISHSLTIATAIWAMSNPEKFKDVEYKLTIDDLKEIIERSKTIKNTSMTEFNVYDDGIRVGKVGETPHFEK